MSSTTWPTGRDWAPQRFQMRVMPNDRVFQGYYSGQSQAVELLGEAWSFQLTLPARASDALGAAREAFFHLIRRSNTLDLWNLKRPRPRGTLAGSPTLRTSAAQLDGTVNILTSAGATLLAGDVIGFGGQVSMVLANATADGSGHMDAVQVYPRVRTALSSGIAVSWDKPLVTFRISDAGGIPVDWMAGRVSEPVSFGGVEA